MNTTTEGRDLLTRIDANLTNHIELVKTHILDDKEAFRKINLDMEWQKHLTYGCVGVLLFIEFISRLK